MREAEKLESDANSLEQRLREHSRRWKRHAAGALVVIGTMGALGIAFALRGGSGWLIPVVLMAALGAVFAMLTLPITPPREGAGGTEQRVVIDVRSDEAIDAFLHQTNLLTPSQAELVVWNMMSKGGVIGLVLRSRRHGKAWADLARAEQRNANCAMAAARAIRELDPTLSGPVEFRSLVLGVVVGLSLIECGAQDALRVLAAPFAPFIDFTY